jgi:8-oxo-dGTP diphosphatase
MIDPLPKKRMGAGALFLDERGCVLLVNPTYKPQWEVPGGIVELDESPRQACQREVQEELGLARAFERLLSISYVRATPTRSDGLMFLFWGGVLSAAELAQIRLPMAELSEYALVDPAAVSLLLTASLGERVCRSLAVVGNDQTLYLEAEPASPTLNPVLADRLPKKPISAGTLFLNDQDQVLLVKPSYKARWGLPGGIVEAGESPRQACHREVQEELGLRKSCERLVSVAYVDPNGEQADSLKFFFWGGELSAAEITQIRLPEEELSDYLFVDPVEAPIWLTNWLGNWVQRSLASLPTQQTLYLE